MVVWTSVAEHHYYAILAYLFEKWNLKIVNNFIDEVEKTMNLIETNPYCFEEFSLNKKYRKGFIHKNVSFYYRVYENEIVVHLFWNNFQNTNKLKKLLK